MSKQIHKLSAGFSMLEMLIALLILSIGLLGVATLQTRGQQFNQVGYLRTQATFLAYDIMERIRINSIRNNLNSYQLPFGPSGKKNYDYSCDGKDKNCDSDQLQTSDLNNWLKLVSDTLPEGEAGIGTSIGLTGNVLYTITISWANIIDRSDHAEKEVQQWLLLQ
jgi:type IV pilus assembly protein PilV